MRSRILIVPALLFAMLVGGCGGSSSNSGPSAQPGTSSTTSSVTAPASSGTGSTDASGCPTSNTRNFAKTRFVADIGGSLFLLNRYVLKPYQAGTFKKGASGRTSALIKAGVAVATSTKLLKNATENAKANPTLCKTVAGPLTQLTSSLGGVVSSLRSGNISSATLGGITGLLGTVKSAAGKAGIPISERQVGLGG